MNTISVCLKKMLGVLIFCEIFLFGSGQVIQLSGGLTLKMFNFILMLIFTCILLPSTPVSKNSVKLFLLFLLCMSLSILVGVMNNGLDNMFYDISPLLYLLTLFFIEIYIRTEKDIKFIIKILKFCAISMAAVYLVYIFLIKLNILNFEAVYLLLSNSSDIIFRGASGAFFYKGFLYMVIGLIFYIAEGKLFSWSGLLLLVAIYFTYTRGFVIIALCSCVFYYLYWLKNHKYRMPAKYFYLLSFLLIIFLSYGLSIDVIGGADRSEGDTVRIQTMREVYERVTASSFFIGHGFGVGVPIRKVHMEMSYLEIFHKQGLLGLLFWGYLFVNSVIMFINLSKNQQRLGIPFLLSIVAVYIQSLFNPFLNNPIGLGIVLISYVSLNRIARIEESQVGQEHFK